ncbi:MAG: hypothetical protein A2087_06970 [Spirochaetes bacterium GWD1_61_31]|nr:MAG: hypothetical protein A2Y37_08500 [Spirochaetes bacterium GWB1_60_80]OHD28471.1 MAG: hypothetical protein A2004_14755 [Spirochaetes bacterium GWC1_61_12]OHD40088.1 MAG: hypothetical protein A2087_06970 [Spirochaetes bacterium GWD1_61_31]OHD45864.1 MAG: hypothetical protein A2Y35_04135 [Spirochaetes bacterium GWE1_60_18]OHD58407.1 MAG: hypothetical protein A2Y32_06525 [Spirochaetes bacterium GWF1_60_12]
MTDPTKLGRLGRRLFWLALLTISVASLLPLSAPGLPGGDKIHHFLAYACLGGLLAIGWWRRRRLSLLLGGWLGLTLYGGLIELAQGYTGRFPEWFDVLANASGALCGLSAGLVARGWLVRLQAKAAAAPATSSQAASGPDA